MLAKAVPANPPLPSDAARFPVTDGRISFRRRNGSVIDLAKASGPEMREVRDEVQMIFQDPYSSLNPRLRLLEIIGEPLINKGIAKSEIEDRVGELLKLVGLRPEFMSRYPHAFSGGQRQRIGIARALAVNPTSSQRTRRFRRSTCLSRRRWSTCCRTCRINSA